MLYYPYIDGIKKKLITTQENLWPDHYYQFALPSSCIVHQWQNIGVVVGSFFSSATLYKAVSCTYFLHIVALHLPQPASNGRFIILIG